MVILEENIEFETDFDKEKIAKEVVEFILKKENCPWDVEVDILITESEEVQDYNREYRDIDKTTDVLSFPNIDWEAPADYSNVDEKEFNASSFNPETNLPILGDICLNRDRIISQAEEYGHSAKREYAFLIAHSMLHLLGYDHMEEAEAKVMEQMTQKPAPHAKRAVLAFLLGVVLVVVFGSAPSLRPSFEVDGVTKTLSMPETIEILMMSIAALILIVGKANVKKAVSGNIFGAGMNAMISIFGIAWMGDTFFNGNIEFFKSHIAEVVTQYPFLFSVALFIMSIMLFSQAATVRTLFPLGIGLGISPLALVAMFPAVNGYFFIPNYPTEVAAINFDTTGTTRIGKYVLNHSFQLSGFITTFVSIGIGYLIITFLY